MFLDRALHHVYVLDLLGAADVDKTPRHLGEHHDRDSARRLIEGRGLVDGQDGQDAEPWSIGTVFGLFILGAASTKDFADIEGDRAGGCHTLPIDYGVKKATWIMAPFFVIPFILIPVGVYAGILTGNALLLNILGGTLIVYGCYTVWLLVRNPDELATTENHPSWTHMYQMMMLAQVGFALAYVF